MKKGTTLFAFILTGIFARAQQKPVEKPVTSGFVRAVEMVLSDYPSNYKHITGDLVLSQGEFEQYASTVMLPGSESCLVGRYHSTLDTTASWQAFMYSSEEFDLAAAEYKQLFHQLKDCHLKMSDGSIYYLDGQFEKATNDMPFVSSALRVQTADERYKEFKIEIELLYQVDKWVVNINMVSKKDDSEMRPDWWEGK